MLTLVGCNTVTKTYTFKLSTGDTIDVALRTSGSYTMIPESPIGITVDGTVIDSVSFMEKTSTKNMPMP